MKTLQLQRHSAVRPSALIMWVAWTNDVPGALTQGATLEEARENLIDAVRMMREPVNLSKLPKSKVRIEQLEV